MKLTVLMCVYNGMPAIKRAVESVLLQTFKDFNFLIIDNGSTDDTQKFLDSLTDKRITIRKFKPVGIIQAHNFGLSLIETEYTAIMDADDYSHPERFEQQITFLESNRQVGLLGCAISYVGNSVSRCWTRHFPSDHISIMHDLIGGKFIIAHASVMFRTEIAKMIGGYRIESFPVPDLDFFMRFSEKCFIANLTDIYHYTRISENSFTQKNLKSILIKQKELLRRKYNNSSGFDFITNTIEYTSVILYKKGLFLYLNNSKFLWLLYVFAASLVSIPKAINMLRMK